MFGPAPEPVSDGELAANLKDALRSGGGGIQPLDGVGNGDGGGGAPGE
jgi:hypothetical protein